jgi:hypothetical protein
MLKNNLIKIKPSTVTVDFVLNVTLNQFPLLISLIDFDLILISLPDLEIISDHDQYQD